MHHINPLSLYSTVTQNHLHWVLAQFCIGYTNMLVSKNAKICVFFNANPKNCVTPNANPQRESVEYRLRWPCTFHVVCAHFICIGYPTQTQFAVEYGL